jgi:hypothetical protein|tara:strand:+ start:286 stop:864 length:579 start_codon:yes stop_codon:yes gene_type:complete
MALIGGFKGPIIAAFSTAENSDNVAKQMDFVVPIKTNIDTLVAPTSGTNYTQDPVYRAKVNGCGLEDQMAIKLGIHATGSYYYGQVYREYIYFRNKNGSSSGYIMQLSEQVGDNYSSFDSSSDFSLTIQNNSTATLRVRQDKDYFTANEVKVYYLGGGTDVTFVGRNGVDASGLGSRGADYDDRYYQTFWIT